MQFLRAHILRSLAPLARTSPNSLNAVHLAGHVPPAATRKLEQKVAEDIARI
jgi:hypothetical protein